MKEKATATTPPMGWNSWDCYGAAVREEEIRGNAEYMAKYMKAHGWEYVVVDIQWAEPGAQSSVYRPFVPLHMDEFSRLVPAPNRFPSTADGVGFKPLADFVHGLGLKFGIHIMRGIPRQAVHANTPIKGTNARARDIAHPNSICPWNTDMYGVDASKEGALAYYHSLFELYAAWGVDFVKVDDIAASRLYGIHSDEIRLIRNAMDHCGREMVLCLSPGPAPLEHAAFLGEHADMWRMTDDFWDIWRLLYEMFERAEKWAPHVGSGHWPDCDMLPLGHLGIRSVDGGGADRWTRFTRDEQVTMMTLWCIFRSPLMIGGELRDNDDWTLSLVTNAEVLAAQQNGLCPRMVYRLEDRTIWTSTGRDGSTYVALFNLREDERDISVALEQLSLDGSYAVRDLWRQEDSGTADRELSRQLPPHGSAFLRLVRLGE